MRAMVFTALLALILLDAFAGEPAATNRPVPGPSAEGRYTPWHDDGVFISVHRTMSAKAAENSIEAIRECYLAGGDAIDCDLRFTRDRVLVTIHDEKPKGYEGQPIGQLPWKEVQDLDLDPERFPAQRIPRFEDVARHAIANNLAIHLDAKEPETREAAVEILKRYRSLHLIRWPLLPTVYNWNQRRDNDASFLKERFGEVEGRMKPYFMAGCKKSRVMLAPGDPRHFRCNDPRTIANLAGRTPDVVVRVRGPYREPVPEHGSTIREQGAEGDAVNRAP